ncbi:terminase gpA endonuclease subunit [Escherichia coli]|uniref:terminase gpA endonuclease subunit n=20 Tax=Pseudomonadota TaxID=1224 RepID=UPI00288BE392|nr:terminase gpA endonuclease subunit [Escherichia coli]
MRQQELDFTDARYICEKTGIWTRDGILWFSSSGEEIEPPDSVTFHIWTAYSPFTTWVQIVKDWMKTKGDTGKRKTFVNTTLGETWEAKIGERPDAEVMAERKEHYSAPVPDRVAYLTAGIDSQLDRYEMRVAWYASIQQEPNGWKTVTTQFYIQEFSEYIAPLQDAVDLEIATEEERSLLEAWNKYRVLLNRVDTSVALGMKLFVTHVTVTVITISKVQNVY